MYAKELEKLDEVVIDLSNELITQLERKFGPRMSVVSDFGAQEYTKHMQPNQIREALMKGYVEMSQINLTICSECLQAEYEAEHMVERLVSGG